MLLNKKGVGIAFTTIEKVLIQGFYSKLPSSETTIVVVNPFREYQTLRLDSSNFLSRQPKFKILLCTFDSSQQWTESLENIVISKQGWPACWMFFMWLPLPCRYFSPLLPVSLPRTQSHDSLKVNSLPIGLCYQSAHVCKEAWRNDWRGELFARFLVQISGAAQSTFQKSLIPWAADESMFSKTSQIMSNVDVQCIYCINFGNEKMITNIYRFRRGMLIDLSFFIFPCFNTKMDWIKIDQVHVMEPCRLVNHWCKICGSVLYLSW